MTHFANARLVQEDELPGLLELYRQLHRNDPLLKLTAELHEHWEAMVNDPSSHIIVVELEGVLVATCVLHVHRNLTRGARPYAFIENVVTHHAYRKSGYGKLALQKAKEIAEEKNCYKIMLLTGQKMEGVSQFYQSAGYNRDAKAGFVLELD